MKSFTVTPKEADVRLDKFILKKAPTMPKSLLYKHFRNSRVKVNGRRCKDFALILKVDDTVELYISDEFFTAARPANYDFLSAKPELNVIYEDENILLCDKPAGVLCHPAKGEYTDTLLSRISRYLYEKGEYDPETDYAPALANRIDRGTAGIVMAAKNPAALRALCGRIKDHSIEKHYLAAISGTPKKLKGELRCNLSKNENKNRVKVSHDKEDYQALLRYEVLLSDKGRALVDVHLITGFSHQIRVQFSSIGHPLLGDLKYGSIRQKREGISRQALYSYRVSFNPTQEEDIISYLNGKTFYAARVPFIEELFGVSSASICGQDS